MQKLKLDKNKKEELKSLLNKSNYLIIISVIFILVTAWSYISTNPKIVQATVVGIDNGFSEEVNQKIDYVYEIEEELFNGTIYGKKINYSEEFAVNQYDLNLGDKFNIEVDWLNNKISRAPNTSYTRENQSVVILIFPLLFTLILIYTLRFYQKRDYEILVNGVLVKGNHLDTQTKYNNKYLHTFEFANPITGEIQKSVITSKKSNIYKEVNIVHLSKGKNNTLILEYLNNTVQNLIISQNGHLNLNIKYKL